jgi:hypothetical protein
MNVSNRSSKTCYRRRQKLWATPAPRLVLMHRQQGDSRAHVQMTTVRVLLVALAEVRAVEPEVRAVDSPAVSSGLLW